MVGKEGTEKRGRSRRGKTKSREEKSEEKGKNIERDGGGERTILKAGRLWLEKERRESSLCVAMRNLNEGATFQRNHHHLGD